MAMQLLYSVWSGYYLFVIHSPGVSMDISEDASILYSVLASSTLAGSMYIVPAVIITSTMSSVCGATIVDSLCLSTGHIREDKLISFIIIVIPSYPLHPTIQQRDCNYTLIQWCIVADIIGSGAPVPDPEYHLIMIHVIPPPFCFHDNVTMLTRSLSIGPFTHEIINIAFIMLLTRVLTPFMLIYNAVIPR